MAHALGREVGLAQQVGLVGQAEDFAQVRQGTCALLSTDHHEMGLMAVEPSHEDHAGLVKPGGRFENQA